MVETTNKPQPDPETHARRRLRAALDTAWWRGYHRGVEHGRAAASGEHERKAMAEAHCHATTEAIQRDLLAGERAP